MTQQRWIAFWTAAATFVYHSAILGPMPQKLICSCCSVVQSCPNLWDPMDGSTPGFPIYHHLPVCSDSYLLSQWCHRTISSSVVPSPALNLSQHQDLFQWVDSSQEVPSQIKKSHDYFLCPGSPLFFSYIFFILSLLLVLLALQFLLFTSLHRLSYFRFHHYYLELFSCTSNIITAFMLVSGYPGLEIKIEYYCTLYNTLHTHTHTHTHTQYVT